MVHSGDEGRTGGGGPGILGVHGGMGIFIPRFRSLGACCLRFLATMSLLFTSSPYPFGPGV